MFDHPVLVVDGYPGSEAIADEFHARSLSLMEEYPDVGLISDAFHSGKRAVKNTIIVHNQDAISHSEGPFLYYI